MKGQPIMPLLVLLNINLKLGLILTKNADVSKKSADFSTEIIFLETTY